MITACVSHLTAETGRIKSKVQVKEETKNFAIVKSEQTSNCTPTLNVHFSLASSVSTFQFSDEAEKQVVSRWERHLPGIHHLQKCLGLDGENRETLVCYFYKQIFNLSNNFLTDPWDTKLSDPLVWLLNYPWSSQPGLRKSLALSRSL